MYVLALFTAAPYLPERNAQVMTNTYLCDIKVHCQSSVWLCALLQGPSRTE